ncbi:MAG: superoxide dismutase [Bacteroidetes bacterium HGW-Bacteroidetes-11]|jgi:Fe-Mn family superoxide dismutase|nr:MAG: superoxide dismutase [Bacteroidetes bacterium HGW-Bacteroidetes-11]
MNFEFPALPYAYDALEPHIDRMTMEIHHTKHHRAYFDKFTAAIQGTELESKSLNDIFAEISKAPVAVRNNGGGFYNHNLFWEILSPNGGGEPAGKLAEDINATFGSFEAFKTKFNDAAANRFGSGWAWLSVKPDKSLCVCSSANQDNPLMDVHDCPGTPILGLDVWEHAYYLKYQNRRPDYIGAFWNLVNWNKVSENYEKTLK